MKGKKVKLITAILITIAILAGCVAMNLYNSKAVNNKTGNRAIITLPDSSPIADPDFYVYAKNGILDMDMFCAERGAHINDEQSEYEEVNWDADAEIWSEHSKYGTSVEQRSAFSEITWIKNNFWEKSDAIEGNKFTTDQKLKFLQQADSSINAQDVEVVFNNQAEKFKLYQTIAWTYTHGEKNPPIENLGGSTRKIYDAIIALASAHCADNGKEVIQITANADPVYNEETKDYDWAVSIKNTYVLPYTLELNVDGKKYTNYTYENGVMKIHGVERAAHTFNIAAATYQVASDASIWVNDSKQDMLEITITHKYQKVASKTSTVTAQGKYSLNIKKVKEDGTILDGAAFIVNKKTYSTTNGIATIETEKVIEKTDETYEYTVEEANVGENYIKLAAPVKIILRTGATVANGNTYYAVTNANFENGETATEVETLNGGTVKLSLELTQKENITTVNLTVPNKAKTYDLALTKTIILSNDELLKKYDFNNNKVVDSVDASFAATIIDGVLKLKNAGTQSTDGAMIRTEFENQVASEAKTPGAYTDVYNNYYKYLTDDELLSKFDMNPDGKIDIFDTLYLERILEIYGNVQLGKDLDRINIVDSSKLNKNGVTTANYNLNKKTYEVNEKSIVTYKLTVYNEGDYSAKDINVTDYLPEYLEVYDENTENVVTSGNATCTYKGQKYTWNVSGKTATTTISDTIKEFTPGNLYKKDVYIKCKLVDTAPIKEIIYNAAEITKSTPLDSEGNEVKNVTDRDSEEDTLKSSTKVVSDYKTRFEEKTKDKDATMLDKSIYNYEDDDDMERIIVKEKELDLSLRKSITKIGTEETSMRDVNESRLPKITKDSALVCLKKGTGEYYHNKEAVNVSKNDYIEYTIRVYNEGGSSDYDGYAKQITDYLPDGLEYYAIVDSNGTWIKDSKETTANCFGSYKVTYDKANKKVIIDCNNTPAMRVSNNLSDLVNKTDLQSYYNAKDIQNNECNPFRYRYQEVKIICKAVDATNSEKYLTNIAEITNSVAVENSKEVSKVEDKDSKAGNIVIGKSTDIAKKQVNLDTYYADRKVDDTHIRYYAGFEDDDDFETVKVVNYDLALRKFITGINGQEVKTRIPNVDVSNLVSGESTTADYVHTKEPEIVHTTDKITYTIRVYNEGIESAYASLVKDDIPQGLEFVGYTAGDGSTNDTYKWKLLDEQGNETTDVSKAKYIQTDYLSKESNVNNLIKGFDKNTMSELDYKDLQVEFKVTEPTTSDRVIINKAQISKETDSKGNQVTDRDSIPDVWNEGEDDQDIEKIKVQYFDLALRKWVTEAIVTEDGKTVTTQTGHKAEDEPEAVVKVDLKKSKIKNVTVKFKYSIRVTNEGEIAGEVKQIRDDIPNGLKFVQEDNPTWKEENGKIVTEELSGTVLQPKESAEVTIVLTWINDANNMGVKINTAEIEKDHNEYGTPDIDSTPGNGVPGEDDIDTAPVMITVKTGSEIITYSIIGIISTIIIATGIILIKKKVIFE